LFEPGKKPRKSKIEKGNSTDQNFDALFSRVLDWSLQQWIAKISRVSVIETSFPKKKFKMAQDRYKDDSLCFGIGQEQSNTIKEDKVLQTACKYKKGTSNYARTKIGRDKSMLESTSKDKMFEVLYSYRYSKQIVLKIEQEDLVVRPVKNRSMLVAQKLCELAKEFLDFNIHRQQYSLGNSKIR
ncbi:11035_t:CDS:2, partial [Gigaspora margarita]